MRPSLFRPESTVAKRQTLLGDVILLQPLSIRIFSAGIFIFTTIAVALLYNSNYSKNISAPGILTPIDGVLKVFSPRQGVVISKRVEEGQVIKSGDVLYEISADTNFIGESDRIDSAYDSSSELLNARKDIIQKDNEANTALSMLEISEQKMRVTSLQNEIKEIDVEITLQEKRLELKNKQYERYVETERDGFISPLGLQEKYDAILEQQGRIRQMLRAKILLVRQLTETTGQLSVIDQKKKLAESLLSRQKLDVDAGQVAAQSTRRTLVIAPQGGTVAAIFAQPGQLMESQVMLTLIPKNAKLEGQVLVSSAHISQIVKGGKVVLRIKSYPYIRYGTLVGKVEAISATTLSRAEQTESGLLDRSTGNDGYFRIRILLPAQHLLYKNQELKLRSGMNIEAQFPTEKKSLMSWLFSPLN